MCIDQSLYGKIRYLHQIEHLSQRQIAKKLLISRHTVEKYMEGATVPSERKPGSGRPTIVTPEMIEFIKACIKEDIIENLPKQKHTARRIYVRLVDEMGYTGSECTIQRRVAQIRDDIKKKKLYVPLAFSPGEAVQVDWGEAYIMLKGEKLLVNYFCMRECYSSAVFVTAFLRQNLESFLQGLLAGFEYFGGVPERVIFDNARVAVKDGFGKHAKVQNDYKAFAEHYCFQPVFCNIYSGNEKGLVENLVGYARRNVCVPMPRIEDLSEMDDKFLDFCDKYNAKHKIASKDATVAVLLLESKKAFLPFPPYRFDTSETRTVAVNPFSLVKYDRQLYSVPTNWADKIVTIKGYGNHVEIHSRLNDTVTHNRQYGEGTLPVFTLDHYLPLLKRKPGAILNAAPVRDVVPKRLMTFLKTLKDPIQVYRVIECYVENDDALMALINAGAPYVAIEPLLKKETSTEQTAHSTDGTINDNIVPFPIKNDHDFQVNTVDLSRYDALMKS